MNNTHYTLSDDITTILNTSGFTAESYVNTTIYHNSIGVFNGRSFVNENNDPIEINLNDFVVQNRNKYDYLKLKDNGEVNSLPLVEKTQDEETRYTRWLPGQFDQYGATIADDDIYYTSMKYVLTGYDYPNKDLVPDFEYPFPADYDPTTINYLQRIMQGADWYYNHNEERSYFNDLLIPHYPAVDTSKYGLGLEILSARNNDYNLRGTFGTDEYRLGQLIMQWPIGETFVSLHDLLSQVTLNENDDTSIYLKLNGTSGDEFGDWIEGYDLYTGDVYITGIQVETVNVSTGETTTENIPVGRTTEEHNRFVLALFQYNAINHTQDILDQSKIINNSPVYTTDENSHRVVNTQIDNFVSQYIKRTRTSRMDNISVYMTPLYERDLVVTGEVPNEYVGKCVVGILDRCYSRYYLAWSDRYGDIQSQPFDGKAEYTEDFERNEAKDYKLRRRVIHNELQPKWKLNTKWLKEDIYPMYEAIFTSPYLLLYDTETDRSWNVILTDSEYKEKTFKTEKKLFNLEITLESNKTQNFIF